jgi:anti-sigma regulatory factor (Ser/Thr protein kinase)
VCHAGNAANSLLIQFCNFQVDSCHPLLADSIVIGVIQLPQPSLRARRGSLDHLRAEGEILVNRYHPAPGAPAAAVEAVPSQADPVAMAVGGQAADTGVVASTLPVGPFGGQTVFLHCDVFCLPAHGTSVSAARSRITEQLDSWGVDESVYEDAALIVSELFTNALVHTDSSEIICRLQTTAQTVLLAVTDQGHGPCGPRVREPDVESGRGLILVSALAELWGVNTEQAEGRTVWALLPCQQGSASSS